MPLKWKTYSFIECPEEELEEILRLIETMHGDSLDMFLEWAEDYYGR